MTRLDLTLTWILCFELNWTETQVYHHVRCQFSQVLGEALIHYVWSKDIKLNDNACAIPIESVWVTNLLSTKVIVLLLLILFILVLHCYCSLQTKPIHSIALHCIAIALHCHCIALQRVLYFLLYYSVIYLLSVDQLGKIVAPCIYSIASCNQPTWRIALLFIAFASNWIFCFLFYFFILFYFILLFKYPKYTVHQKQ